MFPPLALLLAQTSTSATDIGYDVPVHELAYDAVAQTVIPCPSGCLMVPASGREQVTWDALDGTLKLLQDRKVILFYVLETLIIYAILCMIRPFK